MKAASTSLWQKTIWPAATASRERFAADFVDVHDPLDDRLVVRRQNLDAAFPIDFHGVVAGRIVAGGDHDAATGMGVADGERQFGGAAEAIEEKHFEAGGHHDFGAEFGEVARVVAGVVGDGAGESGCIGCDSFSSNRRYSRRRLGRFRRWCGR